MIKPGHLFSSELGLISRHSLLSSKSLPTLILTYGGKSTCAG